MPRSADPHCWEPWPGRPSYKGTPFSCWIDWNGHGISWKHPWEHHRNIPETSWNMGISDIPGIQPSGWSPHPVRCAKVKATPRQQRSWRQRPLVVRYRSTSNPSCEEFSNILKENTKNICVPNITHRDIHALDTADTNIYKYNIKSYQKIQKWLRLIFFKWMDAIQRMAWNFDLKEDPAGFWICSRLSCSVGSCWHDWHGYVVWWMWCSLPLPRVRSLCWSMSGRREISCQTDVEGGHLSKAWRS